MAWRARLLEQLSPKQLLGSPWLRPFAARLSAPAYWRPAKVPVARAAAVGAFFAFATPIAQVPLALGTALLFRMHLPTAAAATFINNPLTFGPVYYAAYRLGAVLLGDTASQSEAQVQALVATPSFSWSAAMLETALGAAIFGLTAAALGYFGTLVLWRLRAARRMSRRGAQPGTTRR